MRILIFGGNRFVGKGVAEILSSEHEVTIFNRSGTGPNCCNIIKCDRNNNDFNINDNYNMIIDFCLYKKEQAELISSKLKRYQKYIFISSGAVYKDNNCLLYNESMPVGGLSAFGNYGIEKSQCENIIGNSFLDYIILRPAYIIGPNSNQPRINYYINNIKNNIPVDVSGDGNKMLSFIWKDDIINLIVEIINNFNSYKKVYNVVGEDFYTSRSLIDEISTFLNIPYTIRENGKDAPFINENYMLSPLKLGKKFTNIKQNLPLFFKNEKSI
jgi:nucleoside-diphosphate-sugar epimerase